MSHGDESLFEKYPQLGKNFSNDFLVKIGFQNGLVTHNYKLNHACRTETSVIKSSDVDPE